MLEPYRVPRSHVALEMQIGAGAYGEVWLARCRGNIVAVKRILSNQVDARTVREFRKECNLMAKLQKRGISHINLVQMKFCCWDDELLLCLEFCALGDLCNILDDTTFHLSWEDEFSSAGALATLCLNIARGVEFMHGRSPTIIHRDLKPQNVLVAGSDLSDPKEWIAKISDFGESREFKNGDNLSMVGTPYYCCPEIVLCEAYNETADVYSFGIMLCDFVLYPESNVRRVTWGGKRFSQMNVVKGCRPSLPAATQTWIKELAKSCWDGNAEKRPSFKKYMLYIQ